MRERGTCAASRTSDGSRARTAPVIFRSDFVQCCSLRASTNDTLAPLTIRATTWRGVTLEDISTFCSPGLAVAEGDPLAVVRKAERSAWGVPLGRSAKTGDSVARRAPQEAAGRRKRLRCRVAADAPRSTVHTGGGSDRYYYGPDVALHRAHDRGTGRSRRAGGSSAAGAVTPRLLRAHGSLDAAARPARGERPRRPDHVRPRWADRGGERPGGGRLRLGSRGAAEAGRLGPPRPVDSGRARRPVLPRGGRRALLLRDAPSPARRQRVPRGGQHRVGGDRRRALDPLDRARRVRSEAGGGGAARERGEVPRGLLRRLGR